MDNDVKQTIKIRVKSISDLARMAASSIAFGQPTYVLRFRSKKNNAVVYGILAVFRDYYKLYGIPLFYYYEDTKGEVPIGANYILVKTESNEEKVELSRGSKPGYVVIPIINLEAPPDFLE